VDTITIPIGEPLTFPRLRELNTHASTEELASAFGRLPTELREQAWNALRLRVALDGWNADAEATSSREGNAS
jgi:hypothetical protein